MDQRYKVNRIQIVPCFYTLKNMGYPVKETDGIEYILGIIMAQKYSLKSGLKCFGNQGEHGASSELTQIHDIWMFTSVDTSEIYRIYRSEAVASLNVATIYILGAYLHMEPDGVAIMIFKGD